ncbi:MAG: 3-phosphoshikimate 1-carboxyvinyltransferase [Clostridiales bacterium]|nr:3-phosphoshikimate 1-carboxyvinyltransferase [Clostridiales bacterium]
MNKKIKPRNSITATIEVQGDKSISHRAVMIGAIAKGVTEIYGFLNGNDCMNTIKCMRELGVKIDVDEKENTVVVDGVGLEGLQPPKEQLDVGNSGTAMRMLSGILAAQEFDSTVTGDEYICRRPMKRIIDPLNKMGASITGVNDNYAPLEIKGRKLSGISYNMPVASAQVKSSILLAGLYAKGETIVIEPALCRDHTEIMLKNFGAEISKKDKVTFLRPSRQLYGKSINIPGDISSAAFFIVAALIVPNSQITIKNVGLNFTRTGILSILKDMGARIEILNRQILSGEWIGDIKVTSSQLFGTTIQGGVIPRAIDEIPIAAVAAAFATGTTIIKGAKELRVKESDRIHVMAEHLKTMGVDVIETEDGLIIEGKGGKGLKSGTFDSFGDHRIAMSMAVAGLALPDGCEIENAEWANVSFTNFYDNLENI